MPASKKALLGASSAPRLGSSAPLGRDPARSSLPAKPYRRSRRRWSIDADGLNAFDMHLLSFALRASPTNSTAARGELETTARSSFRGDSARLSPRSAREAAIAAGASSSSSRGTTRSSPTASASPSTRSPPRSPPPAPATSSPGRRRPARPRPRSFRRRLRRGRRPRLCWNATKATAGTAFREAVGGLDGFELFAAGGAAKAITEHYTQNPDFIWVAGEDISERAREAVRVLGEAASHGLSPADYSVAIPGASGMDAALLKTELIRFEMTLSARVLRYVSDVERGRIDPNRVSGYHDFLFPAKPLDMVAALKALAATANPRDWLELSISRAPSTGR